MRTDLIVKAYASKSSTCRICSLTLRYSVRNLRSSLALWRGDGKLKNIWRRTSVCLIGSTYRSCNELIAMR